MTETPDCTLTRLAFELQGLGKEHASIQKELNRAAWYCTQWAEVLSEQTLALHKLFEERQK